MRLPPTASTAAADAACCGRGPNPMPWWSRSGTRARSMIRWLDVDSLPAWPRAAGGCGSRTSSAISFRSARRAAGPSYDSSPGSRTSSPGWLPGWEDRAGDLGEADPAVGRSRSGGPDRDPVAVLEEGALNAGNRKGLLATPRQLEQRSALVLLCAADRARGEQVAHAKGRAVDGQVREHLRGGPVHRPVRRASDHLAVQLDLEVDVVASHGAGTEVVERFRILARKVDASCRQCLERGHPGGNRGGERLAEVRPEWNVLPCLDVACRPVVECDDPENVLRKVIDGDRVTLLAGRAHDVPELGFDVEALGGAVRRCDVHRRLALATRPSYVGSRDHHGAGATVISDRKVTPVR